MTLSDEDLLKAIKDIVRSEINPLDGKLQELRADFSRLSERFDDASAINKYHSHRAAPAVPPHGFTEGHLSLPGGSCFQAADLERVHPLQQD